MKILAFNCSPRARRSNTERIIAPFLEGSRTAGAETETVYARKLDLLPCRGCMTCMFKTPGVCVQKDDRDLVAERFKQSDLVIFGTPVYVFNMSSAPKSIILVPAPKTHHFDV